MDEGGATPNGDALETGAWPNGPAAILLGGCGWNGALVEGGVPLNGGAIEFNGVVPKGEALLLTEGAPNGEAFELEGTAPNTPAVEDGGAVPKGEGVEFGGETLLGGTVAKGEASFKLGEGVPNWLALGGNTPVVDGPPDMLETCVELDGRPPGCPTDEVVGGGNGPGVVFGWALSKKGLLPADGGPKRFDAGDGALGGWVSCIEQFSSWVVGGCTTLGGATEVGSGN